MIAFTESAVRERGKRLELALAHAGLNATALAQRLGITPAALSDIKHGKSKAPDRWVQIADILGVDVEWIAEGGGSPSWEPSRSPEQPPPWAAQLLAEVQALRAEVAELRGNSQAGPAAPPEVPTRPKRRGPPPPSVHLSREDSDALREQMRQSGVTFDTPAQDAVRDIRAALEPEERQHEPKPTYPPRSPDLTGAPRHGE